MNKRLLLSAAILSSLLTGCNLDNDDNEQQDYYGTHSGLYTAAYEKDGKAQLVRLAINELGATLVLTSDREVSTASVGSLVDQSIIFSSQTHCEKSSEGFSCTIDSLPVDLAINNTRHYTALNLLAGDYKVIGDAQVINVNLDSQGTFVAQYQGCNITGSMTNENTYFSIAALNNVCTKEDTPGVVFINNDNLGPASLEVYLAGNILTGDWIKM